MARIWFGAAALLALPGASGAQGVLPPATTQPAPAAVSPAKPDLAPKSASDKAWTPPPSVAAEERKKEQAPEPSLDLPIGWYVTAGALGGLGAAAGILSAGPERDLRDPAQHTTPSATRNLYWRAYYGGMLSKGLYALSGAAGGWAAYKTQAAIRDYLSAKAKASMSSDASKTEPKLDAALAAAPGEANLTLTYRF